MTLAHHGNSQRIPIDSQQNLEFQIYNDIIKQNNFFFLSICKFQNISPDVYIFFFFIQYAFFFLILIYFRMNFKIERGKRIDRGFFVSHEINKDAVMMKDTLISRIDCCAVKYPS